MSENAVNSDEKVFGQKLSGVGYIDRIGVYGIAIDNEGKIATIKTPTGYFLPGGGIEIGETNKECIEREFIEETGFEVSIEKYIGKASLYHLSKTNKYFHGIGYFYIVNLKSMTNKKTEDDHELLWIRPDECVRSLFLEHQAWAVSEALKGKV